MKLLLWLTLLSLSSVSLGANVNIGEAVTDVDGQLNSVALLVTGAAVLLGLFFVGVGIMKIKSSQEAGGGQRDSSVQAALALIIVGGLLTTVGSVVFMSKDTIFGTNSGHGDGSVSQFTTQDRGHLDEFMSQGSSL